MTFNEIIQNPARADPQLRKYTSSFIRKVPDHTGQNPMAWHKLLISFVHFSIAFMHFLFCFLHFSILFRFTLFLHFLLCLCFFSNLYFLFFYIHFMRFYIRFPAAWLPVLCQFHCSISI